MALTTFGREEFLSERWAYGAGEHVTVLGPTGSGKTHLLWQLVEKTAHPEVPAVVLAMKPKDSTASKWGRQLEFRTVRDWPPSRNLFRAKPSGWMLWPKHTFDVDIDDDAHERIFGNALHDSYRRGNRIVVVDELLAATDLHLERRMRALWTRGRSMGTGLWGGTQKPTNIPTYAYGQAQHLFLFNDPDRRSRDRFDEIGGQDSRELKSWVVGLGEHQCLYVRRQGGRVCIIDK